MWCCVLRFCISIVIAASLLGFHAHLAAQSLSPLPSGMVYGKVKGLRHLTSVLYVAAHPDDENTRLLAWLASGQNIRTAYLSITRGDGGQNILGDEQGAALGLIRTYELLEARKLDGAEQFFARAVDFGFSKAAAETFTKWDTVLLIADVIRVIRTVRPDVVICRFPPNEQAGHGHHAASAILTQRAFEYIHGTLQLSDADAQRMSDALRGTTPWTPARLLFNAFRFGQRNTISDTMFSIPVGQYDAHLGMGYGELAGISRSIHRSQGVGTPSNPGVQREYFATWHGSPPVRSLFDGVDTTWNRVGRPDVAAAVDRIVQAFNFEQPARSLPALFELRRTINTVQDEWWRMQKLRELDAIIVMCMGLKADVTTAVPTVLAGNAVETTVRITQRTGGDVRLLSATWPDGASMQPTVIPHDSAVITQVTTTIPTTIQPTQPHWLRGYTGGAMFTAGGSTADDLILPTKPSELTVTITLLVGSDTVVVTVPLSYKKLDPLRGDVFQPLRVTPIASVEPITTVVRGTANALATFRITAYADVSNGLLELAGSAPSQLRGITLKANTDTVVTVPIPQGVTGRVGAYLLLDDAVIDATVRTLTYDHVPTLQYLEPAVITVLPATIRMPGKRIGFLSGAGEKTPDVLRGLGVEIEEIGASGEVHADRLATYGAVLVGIRACNVRKQMANMLPTLLEYVRNGGTLVMQYNTMQDVQVAQLGPYPFQLSRKRVTQEDAPVTLLQPTHPVFQQPNVITQSDFANWVQERCLYVPEEFSEQYTPLLSMQDSGEEPLTGSLLYARYGSGVFIYTSLALWRQVPAGVPGAIKLMCNLLSAE